MNAHKNLTQAFCVHCDRREFNSSIDLQNHNDSAHKKFKHICSSCKNAFPTQADLQQHYNEEHSKMGGKGGGGGGGKRGGGGGKGGGGGGKSAGGSSSKGGSSGGMMVAPGSGGGSHISRDTFESNPQGYFSGLHSSEKGNK
uniref:C2H2-type domain-containing protein n=1 Tax=Quercus lobata TaxID=97700 RepID=A0A7N2KKF9_QUELO